ncbi:hypothetical protein BCR44DRAFT_1510143 [Catenaria anguillulae PL171]|uniref:Uncharacterized protein n=1 Tax=Catenaria anguillulae PL171 TaxID=765915 RepID=A0A1Y2HXN0_9FUNG|nr:hypothetical protein BCR44DRAFT_1510143 [Catenaria anguillulae PL171]
MRWPTLYFRVAQSQEHPSTHLQKDAAAHQKSREEKTVVEEEHLLDEQKRRETSRAAARTDSERQERAAGERARKSAVDEAHLLSEQDAARIQTTYSLALPSPQEVDTIVPAAVNKFQADSGGRRTCVVTDCDFSGSEITSLSLDSPVFPWVAIRKVLRAPSSVTNKALKRCYDLSTVDPRFAELAKNPKALVKPPMFAIADGFGIGEADVFTNATWLALAQLRGKIDVNYGGAGSVIRSHNLHWDNSEGTAISAVPVGIAQLGSFHVILAGPFTSAQEIALKKRYSVSSQQIITLIDFLKSNNPLYAKVPVNNVLLQALMSQANDAVALQITTRVNDVDLIDRARASTEVDTRVVMTRPYANDIEVLEDGVGALGRAENDTDAAPSQPQLEMEDDLDLGQAFDTDNERHDKDNNATTAPAASLAHPAFSASRSGTDGESTVVLRRSPVFLEKRDKSFLEKLYPHLLPFGRGGLPEQRENRIRLLGNVRGV